MRSPLEHLPSRSPNDPDLFFSDSCADGGIGGVAKLHMILLCETNFMPNVFRNWDVKQGYSILTAKSSYSLAIHHNCLHHAPEVLIFSIEVCNLIRNGMLSQYICGYHVFLITSVRLLRLQPNGFGYIPCKAVLQPINPHCTS